MKLASVKPKRAGTLKYYESCDVLYFLVNEGRESKAIEVTPGVTVELDDRNEIIGIEILDASNFLSSFALRNFSQQIKEETTHKR